MSQFWSPLVHSLTPYVPGEQPKLANLIKLNTNENPYPPSPHAVAAMQAELGADGSALRLYPDPNADRLKEAVVRHFADCGIGIEALMQKEAPPSASVVPIVLLINPVLERRMNEAIAAIEALDSIRAPVVRIRLEYLDSD